MFISKIIFYRDPEGIYKTNILSRDSKLDIAFILFESGNSIEFIKNSLIDEKCKGLSGNRYQIYKSDGDKLRIGDLYDEEEKFYIDFSKKTLLKLLDEWQDLVSKNTQEIVFYRNGDEYGMVDAQDFHEA